MSALRPTLRASTRELMPISTALWLIREAVKKRRGLLDGELEDGEGHFCAIGTYFEDYPKTALSTALVDEVAAVNDSYPHLSRTKRKEEVLKWLNWRIKNLGAKK